MIVRYNTVANILIVNFNRYLKHSLISRNLPQNARHSHEIVSDILYQSFSHIVLIFFGRNLSQNARHSHELNSPFHSQS